MSISRKEVRRRINLALDSVNNEISLNSGGKYGRGLASEGRAGGYAQALRDVLLILDGVEPGGASYFYYGADPQ